MNKKFRQTSGLTFIEVLLVATLFAIIGTALYSTLSSALNIWKRTQRMAIEEDVTVFFDRFGQDLRQTFYYSQIPFVGKEEKVSFATIVTTRADDRSTRAEEEIIEQIGAVEYYWDFNQQKVYRRQANYAQAMDEAYQEPVLMMSNISGFKIRYYYLGESELLVHSVAQDVVPANVEVTVKFIDESGEHEMRRFLSLPVGT